MGPGCSGHRWRRSVVGARAEVDGHVLRTGCRWRSPLGLFVTLAKPTAPMKKEAASAGVLDTGFGNFARLRIRTIEDLFAGKKPAMPPEDPATLTHVIAPGMAGHGHVNMTCSTAWADRPRAAFGYDGYWP